MPDWLEVGKDKAPLADALRTVAEGADLKANPCPRCHGRGSGFMGLDCPRCNGSGRKRDLDAISTADALLAIAKDIPYDARQRDGQITYWLMPTPHCFRGDGATEIEALAPMLSAQA